MLWYTGCCTDLCTLQLSIVVKLRFSQQSRSRHQYSLEPVEGAAGGGGAFGLGFGLGLDGEGLAFGGVGDAGGEEVPAPDLG